MKAHRCGRCSQHFPLPLGLKPGAWHTETMLPLQLAPKACKSDRLGSTLSSSNWKLCDFGKVTDLSERLSATKLFSKDKTLWYV